jgi:hypothetical protein
MTRSERTPVDVGQVNWQSFMNGNFQKLFDLPFPMAILGGEGGGGLDEGDLQAQYAAADFNASDILVMHSGASGYDNSDPIQYKSDGSSWRGAQAQAQVFRTISALATQGDETIMVATGAGGHNLNLSATTFGKRRVWFFRNNSAGTVTLVPSSGNINGAGSLGVLTLTAVTVIFDGTDFWTV